MIHVGVMPGTNKIACSADQTPELLTVDEAMKIIRLLEIAIRIVEDRQENPSASPTP